MMTFDVRTCGDSTFLKSLLMTVRLGDSSSVPSFELLLACSSPLLTT